MHKRCTHREYYGQFVNDGVISAVVRTIGARKILASTDPHLNDIPLHRWDALAGYSNRQYSREHERFTGGLLMHLVGRDLSKANGGGVSPSDLVCVAKEAARQYKEKHDER
jgi:hypothetical protein